VTSKEFLGTASLMVGCVGYMRYIMAVLKSHSKPHAFSWIIWTSVCAIVFVAQLSKNAGPGAWASGLGAAFCVTITVLALRRGEKRITLSDWLMFMGALAAIPLWIFTKDPLGSVILVTAIDGMGFYPTFRKSYIRPNEEAMSMYMLDSGKYVLAILAIESYSATTLIYPLFVVLSNSVFVMMLLWRRGVVKKA